MSQNMSRAEREEFLAGVHVGVLSVVTGEGSGALAVPVWYGYVPGGAVIVSTGRTSRKAHAIRSSGRFTLCVQDELPPYKYVTVEGPATVQEITQDERRDLARRYLGPEGGDAYIASVPGGDKIMLRLTPEHWLTEDQGKDAD